SARRADSRPEPGPLTRTSTSFMPNSCALRPASSAAICAAYGVDLREPLKPCVPADDQAMVLPCASVIVTRVLLNVALTCATPELMFLRSRRRGRAGVAAEAVCGLAIVRLLLCRYLLARDRPGLALACASVGVGALAAHRKALAVAQAAIAAEVHQPLDVHRDLAAQV